MTERQWTNEPTPVKIDGDNNVSGLTIRAHFAAMAMQGLIAVPRVSFEMATVTAVQYADALIAELNKNDHQN